MTTDDPSISIKMWFRNEMIKVESEPPSNGLERTISKARLESF